MHKSISDYGQFDRMYNKRIDFDAMVAKDWNQQKMTIDTQQPARQTIPEYVVRSDQCSKPPLFKSRTLLKPP